MGVAGCAARGLSRVAAQLFVPPGGAGRGGEGRGEEGGAAGLRGRQAPRALCSRALGPPRGRARAEPGPAAAGDASPNNNETGLVLFPT